jgi:hypothetical protein
LNGWRPTAFELVVQGERAWYVTCGACHGTGRDNDASAERVRQTMIIHDRVYEDPEPRRCPECGALAAHGRFCHGHWLEEQVAAAEHYCGIHRILDDR